MGVVPSRSPWFSLGRQQHVTGDIVRPMCVSSGTISMLIEFYIETMALKRKDEGLLTKMIFFISFESTSGSTCHTLTLFSC